MKYRELNLIQGTPEWLSARRERITASQVPVILRVSPYQKPNQLLEEKFTGIEPPVDPFKEVLFQRGHDAEAAARDWVQRNMGLDMKPAVLVSEEIPELMASLDGFEPSKDLIFEAKYMGSKALADVAAGKIKPHHFYQVQAQLLVSGAKKCIYFAVDESGDAHISEIGPDEGAFKLITKAVDEFVYDLNALKAKRDAYLNYKLHLEIKYTPEKKTRGRKAV